MKVAILYYGQIRVHAECDFGQTSVEAYKALHGSNVLFDTYIYFTYPDKDSIWYTEYSKIGGEEQLIKRFNPKKYIIETQKDFSDRSQWLHHKTVPRDPKFTVATISQLYAINQVCNLVEDNMQYDRFILIRSDAVLDYWRIPTIDKLDPQACQFFSDYYNIFGRNTLEVCRNLMQYTKDVPLRESILSPEQLRYQPMRDQNIRLEEQDRGASFYKILKNPLECLIEACRNNTRYYISHLSPFHVNYRQVEHNKMICRFFPKSSVKGYQWVGLHTPKTAYNISFNVTFIRFDEIDKFREQVGSKNHNPDELHKEWMSSMKVGEVQRVRLPTLVGRNPFILVFLDTCLNSTEIVVEISNIDFK